MIGIHDDSALPSYYYYIDPTAPVYPNQQPNPLDDLISVYGLTDLSKQVTRTNPDGTKAVKLRKSYKNQIQDLSGKFSIIPTRENGRGGDLSQIVFHNQDSIDQMSGKNDLSEENLKHQMINRDLSVFQQDWQLYSRLISQFGKSYPHDFKSQGFEIEDLAFDLDGSSIKSKKRKNKSSGSSIATPNSEIQDEYKRKRLE